MSTNDLCGPMGRPAMRGPGGAGFDLKRRLACLDAARTNTHRQFHYRNVYADGTCGLAVATRAHAKALSHASGEDVIARVKVYPKF